jgi:hypothetical protein
MQKNLIFSSIIFILGYIFLFYGNETYCMEVITSFKDVETTLLDSDSESLILFDIDETLITASSKILRPSVIHYNRSIINNLLYEAQQNLTEPLTEHSIDQLNRELFLNEPYMVTEPSLSTLIKNLQKKYTVLGITEVSKNLLNPQLQEELESPTVSQWRYDILKRIGIDFNTPRTKSIVKEQGLDAYYYINPLVLYYNDGKNDYFPLLYQGIFFTDGLSKGKALELLLKKTTLTPSQIFFFDDNKDHVESVAPIIKGYKIPFKGYIYISAHTMSASLDENIARVQLTHLIQNKKWISEKEAQDFLNTYFSNRNPSF